MEGEAIRFLCHVAWSTWIILGLSSAGFAQVTSLVVVPYCLGVNTHFVTPMPGELDALVESGIGWIRTDLPWNEIEKEPGNYDFKDFDQLVDALSARKVRIMFILDYGNKLYGNSSPRTPEARAAFASYAGAVVAHYKGRGILWEMWNEPNIPFWQPKPNAQEYARLCLETFRAIKEVAPAEKFVGPAVAGMDFSYLEECFKLGLLQTWDAVSVHPYRDEAPETVAHDYAHLRDLIGKYCNGGKIPIISSEWGYSAIPPAVDEKKQSYYVVRQALANQLNGVALSIWYDWRDDGSDPKEREHHFGLIKHDGSKKLAFQAVKTYTHFFQDYRFTRRIPLPSADDYLLEFSSKKRTRYAVWTTQRTAHSARLPVKFRAAVGVDYLGANQTFDPLALTISEQPKYFYSKP